MLAKLSASKSKLVDVISDQSKDIQRTTTKYKSVVGRVAELASSKANFKQKASKAVKKLSTELDLYQSLKSPSDSMPVSTTEFSILQSQ